MNDPGTPAEQSPPTGFSVFFVTGAICQAVCFEVSSLVEGPPSLANGVLFLPWGVALLLFLLRVTGRTTVRPFAYAAGSGLAFVMVAWTSLGG